MLKDKKIRQLKFLYQGGGAGIALGQLIRAFGSPLYQREVRYVVARRVHEQSPYDSANSDGECHILESVDALQAVESEIPSTIFHSIEGLKSRLERGCILFLAFAHEQFQRNFVGYSIEQRGVIATLGREFSVSPDILFNHYREFLPQYRGKKIKTLYVSREEYCRQKGVKVRCTVVAPYNKAALRYVLNDGYEIVGTLSRVSLLSGLFVRWCTPWKEIENAIREII